MTILKVKRCCKLLPSEIFFYVFELNDKSERRAALTIIDDDRYFSESLIVKYCPCCGKKIKIIDST